VNTANTRLSVPAPRTKLPRPLANAERDALVALADVLLGPSERADAPSRCPEYVEKLELALATRSESFEGVVAAAVSAVHGSDSVGRLRDLHDNDPEGFQVLSAVLAGAYLMVPSVRDAVGYPGQRADIPRLEEAVDEIMDGILDPVLERGHFYVAPPAAS
jgi:hypothetical protein